MSFGKTLRDFFESLFFGSSPEVIAKKELRRIESELHTNPPLLTAGMLQPLFAQALFVLYKNTVPLQELLSATLFNEHPQKKISAVSLLMNAGFPPDMRKQLDLLSYEKKKAAVEESTSAGKTFEIQRSQFDKIIHEIGTGKTFKQIQGLLLNLEQLYDISCFNFSPFLRVFDRDFSPENPEHEPVFNEVSLYDTENMLMDLYYLVARFEITGTMLRALAALKSMQQKSDLNESDENQILQYLKPIAASLNKILNEQILSKLLIVLKKNLSFSAPTAKYSTNYIDLYCHQLRTQFNADKERMDMELQDEQISKELHSLFGSRPLDTITGYNAATNEVLRDSKHPLFMLTVPAQILKTFLHYFFTSNQEALLDDIVVEGFFTDQVYQNSFASFVFNCKESRAKIASFEAQFADNPETGQNPIFLLVDTAKRNVESAKQLESLIHTSNKTAKEILQDAGTNFAGLIKILTDIISDYRRGKPEIITNAKLLFLSSRNKDKVEVLEKNFQYWLKFIEIMGHYVAIKKSEQPK